MDKDRKKQILNILRILAVLVILYALFKGVLILIVLIFLSLSMSFLVNHFKLRNIGIELVTLVAVLSGIKYGSTVSLILTFFLILYHLAAGGFFGPYWFWTIPAWSMAGFICGFFPNADVVKIGIYATIGINFNNVFFTGVASPGFLPKYLIYAISNVLFNIILFSAIAYPLKMIMA